MKTDTVTVGEFFTILEKQEFIKNLPLQQKNAFLMSWAPIPVLLEKYQQQQVTPRGVFFATLDYISYMQNQGVLDHLETELSYDQFVVLNSLLDLAKTNISQVIHDYLLHLRACKKSEKELLLSNEMNLCKYLKSLCEDNKLTFAEVLRYQPFVILLVQQDLISLLLRR